MLADIKIHGRLYEKIGIKRQNKIIKIISVGQIAFSVYIAHSTEQQRSDKEQFEAIYVFPDLNRECGNGMSIWQDILAFETTHGVDIC